jgi:hypothetical protein
LGSSREGPLAPDEHRVWCRHARWEKWRVAPRHDEHLTVDARDRPELTSWHPLAAPHLPPGDPGRGQQRGRRERGPLLCHLVLDDQIRPLHERHGVVEQAMENRRGLAERETSHDPERAVRQPEMKEVALYDAYFARSHPGCGLAEPCGPDRVDLYCDDFCSSSCKGAGKCSCSCTNLYDELARAKPDLINETLGALRSKEVLAETATSLVSFCPRGSLCPRMSLAPPVHGHGAPPLHPLGLSTPPPRAMQRSCGPGRTGDRFSSLRSASPR